MTIALQNTICYFKDAWYQDFQFLSWVSKQAVQQKQDEKYA